MPRTKPRQPQDDIRDLARDIARDAAAQLHDLKQQRAARAAHVMEHSGCDDHPDPAVELRACEESFVHFLRHWRFKNRETGAVQTFRSLWPGQADAALNMQERPWLILLKAGKLGFTELECAYDGWVARFRQENARVHLFSMNGPASKTLLEMVRFGLQRLPHYMRLRVKGEIAGGDTTTQLRLDGGPDDERIIVSYAATENVSIDASCAHAHVDELARMMWPGPTWASIQSTIAPGGTGSVHIVSRGQGDQNEMANLWSQAVEGTSALHPFFAAWDQRPRYPVRCPQCRRTYHGNTIAQDCPGITQEEANGAWYAELEASGMPQIEIFYLAPRTADEALSGDNSEIFVPLPVWDACFDPDLPALEPGDPTPVVIAADAAVSHDCFACVIVSRHPHDPSRVAVRGFRFWSPEDFADHRIDFDVPDRWLRTVAVGGCVEGHPHTWRREPAPVEGCAACTDGAYVTPLNVVQITYDEYQLHDMMSRIQRDEIAWCSRFDQGAERLVADYSLRIDIMQRRLAHPFRPERTHPMRQHIGNANAHVATREDSRLRIVKRGAGKIDLTVSLSMGRKRCLDLDLEAA